MPKAMAVTSHKSLRVAENFYCYIWQGMGNNCNAALFSHVLRGERPHILVDPGHIRNELREACFDSLTEAIQKDGLKIEEVGLVIGTHYHPDHFEASQSVAEKSGALIALSHEEDEFYRTMGLSFYNMFGIKAPQARPFFYLKEGDLDLGIKGKVSLKVLLTPGHSPGSISLSFNHVFLLTFYNPAYFSSVGRTDFPGGSPSLLRESIERLSQLDVEHLIPGHSTEPGKIISGKSKVDRNFQMVKLFV